MMTREQTVLCELLHADAADPAVNWDALLDLARKHLVLEQLQPVVSRVAPYVPAAVRAVLTQHAFETVATNLRFTRQLVDVLDYLRAHGVRVLSFRGPALAAAMYGHLGLRSIVDLDLLVDPGDALRVRPLLLARGYTLPARRRKRAGSLLYGLLPGAGRDDNLYAPRDDMAAVDLHVAFSYWTQGIRLDTRALFARAITVEVAGLRVPTLCREDLLLVLAIHGMMHGWAYLRHVRDVHATIGHIDDWQTVIARAERARMRRVLLVALLLAHDLLGSRVPRDVLERAAADADAMAIVRDSRARLFAPPADWDPRPWFRAFQDNRAGRLRFAARTLVYEWFLKWPWDEWLGRRRAPQS